MQFFKTYKHENVQRQNEVQLSPTNGQSNNTKSTKIMFTIKLRAKIKNAVTYKIVSFTVFFKNVTQMSLEKVFHVSSLQIISHTGKINYLRYNTTKINYINNSAKQRFRLHQRTAKILTGYSQI